MNYQVLSRQNHQNLRLRAPEQPWAFARERSFVALVAGELAEAIRIMPVAFRIQDDQVGMVGLMGFGQNNLFVDSKGNWVGQYIPAVLRTWPFALVRREEQQVVVVDVDSDRFSETEGEPLFGEDGQPAERLQKIVEFIKVMAQQEVVTQRGVASIRAAGVLEPWEPVVRRPNGEPLRLQGLHRVSEQALGKLSDEDFLTLRREGGLPLIYAHMLSLRSLPLLEQLARQQAQAQAQSQNANGGLPPTLDLTDDYLKF